MSNFVLEFKLRTEGYQEHILEKRFEIARKIYNALVTKIAKSYHELTKTKKYRGIQDILIEYKNNRESELRKHKKRLESGVILSLICSEEQLVVKA